MNKQPTHQIPGYGGYVTGVKSENVYGQTFGKTSLASSGQTICRGIDLPVHEKFKTTSADTLVDHSQSCPPTVA